MHISNYLLIQGLIYSPTAFSPVSWNTEILIYENKIISIAPKEFALKYYNIDERTITKIKLPSNFMIMPGIIDSHTHPLAGSLQKLNCSLNKAKSWNEAKIILLAYYKRNNDLEWIFASGYEDSWLEGYKSNTPLDLLDELEINKPITITRFDGHAFWCNSIAIKLANVTIETKDPIGGIIGKQAKIDKLELDGLFHDEAMKIIRKSFPKLNEKRLQEAYERATKKLIRKGITCFADASTKDLYLATYVKNSLASHNIDNKFKAPLSKIYLSWKDFGLKDYDWGNLSPKEKFQVFSDIREKTNKINGNIKIDTIKIFVDGVVESLSAALKIPYKSKLIGNINNLNYGLLHYQEKQLLEIISLAREFGFNLHYHVVGDEAFRLIISCIKKNNLITNFKPIKHTLAHIQLVDVADLFHFPNNVSLCFSPLWFYADFSFKATKYELGLERCFNLYPINYFDSSKNDIGFGSDWPISSMNPFKAMEVALTHLKLGENPQNNQKKIFSPDHKINICQALYFYTLGSAKICGEEKNRGSLEIGKIADLIVLDRNLLKINLNEIHKTKVLLTIIDGQIVFNKLKNSYFS